MTFRGDKGIRIRALVEQGCETADIAREVGCGTRYINRVKQGLRAAALAGGQPFEPTAAGQYYSAKQRAEDDALLACPPTAPHKAWFPKKSIDVSAIREDEA